MVAMEAEVMDVEWKPPRSDPFAGWWATPRPSLGFRCQQLLPFGSRSAGLILCLCLSLGTCGALRACLVSKVPGVDKYVGKRGWVCPSGVCLCACLSAFECWGLQGRLEFIHIPKNAGTNVERAGRDYGVSWSQKSIAFRGNRQMPDGSFCSSYHAPPNLFEGLNPYAGAETFCVTRHPFDRAVSEYQYLLAHNWAPRYAEKYDNGLFAFPECSVEGLNHYVQKTLLNLQRGMKYIDDCHHVPQVEYIWDSHGARLCANILRTDEFPDSFNSFMKSRGYPVELGEEKVYSSDKLCADLSVDSLTTVSRSLLLEVYADDFLWLNYSVDYP